MASQIVFDDGRVARIRCHHCLTQADLTTRRTEEDLLALLKAPCSRCGRSQQDQSQIQGLPN